MGMSDRAVVVRMHFHGVLFGVGFALCALHLTLAEYVFAAWLFAIGVVNLIGAGTLYMVLLRRAAERVVLASVSQLNDALDAYIKEEKRKQGAAK